MSNRSRLIPMSGYESIAEARQSTREASLKALEEQVDLLRWIDGPDALGSYQRFMRAYTADPAQHPQLEALGGVLMNAIKRIAEKGGTYFVSHDMTEMVKQAAEAMPPEGLSPIDLPSPSGFLIFDHPIPLEDELSAAEDGCMRLHGFAWLDGFVNYEGESIPGVNYYLFMKPEDYVEYGEGEMDEREQRTLYGPTPIYDFSGWRYGMPWNTVPDGEVEQAITEDGTFLVAPIVDATRRVLLTTWKMLQQTVVSIETERPYRALHKRAMRYIPDPGDVVVMKLRKEYNPESKYADEHPEMQHADDEGPWYTHRFLVRGHWRRQRFGEERSETKIIWISPFIKGPESEPLVLKTKVFSLEQ